MILNLFSSKSNFLMMNCSLLRAIEKYTQILAVNGGQMKPRI